VSEAAERKLAAILSADVVGYTRLLAQDEGATIRTLTDYREAIAMLVRQHRGRVVDAPGDNVLAEFPTALDAVQSAVEIQRVLRARNTDLPSERRMEFRMGIHLGDVRVEGERIYGDGVNIAARLEKLAAPGGLCISATVHEQVRNKLEVAYDDLGDQTVKNIPDQVHVFQVMIGEGPRPGAAPPAPPRRRLRTAALVTGAVALLIGVGIWASWPLATGWVLDRAGLGGAPMNPSLPERPSIAVLPFANLSNDPEQEYFSDGITEDLTTDLSRNPELFVIARNSAFSYKGKNVRVEDVGRELGVRYVLEGSVRKAGDRVRITAQLIDATSGFHVWSERYDRELADIFNLQSEISERILGTLQVEIGEAEARRIRSKPTDNLTAYDLGQQALYHFNRYTRKDNLEARRLVERAVELDPEYAFAWGLLGSTYTVESGFAWNLDPTLMDRAEELLSRALALDPAVPGPHIGLSAVYLFRDRPVAAAVEAEKGIELAPSWPISHYFLGVAMAQRGKFVEATRAINRAQRLDPKSPSGLFVIIPFVNLAAGRTDVAVEMFEQVRTSNADIINARIPLAALYEIDGRHAEAQALVREILDVNPEMTAEAAAAKFIASLLGEDRAAEWRIALQRAGLP
jgi:adenylate cyclase